MSEGKGGNIGLVALLVCAGAAVIFLIGGANMWTAIAAVALCGMGLGMAFFITRG